MAIVTGKVQRVAERKGSNGHYWFVTINGVDYYTSDPYYRDKEGAVVAGEQYTTRQGKPALRAAVGSGGVASQPRSAAPAPTSTHSVHTMTMSYAKDIVTAYYARQEVTGATLQDMVMDTLTVYRALCQALLDGLGQAETSTPAEKAMLQCNMNDDGQPSASPQVDRAMLRRNIVSLGTELGVIPVRAAKKYIGRAVQSLDELSDEELTRFHDALRRERTEPEDIPF